MGLIGLGAFGFYLYALAVDEAFIGLLDALNPGHVEVGEQSIWVSALPHLGAVSVVASAALLLFPAVIRRFHASKRES